MTVTAWTNGKTGYGIKIAKCDRDKYFKPEWEKVSVTLPNGKLAITNVDKKSFWNDTCRELISFEFRNWFKDAGIINWQKGNPPNFELVPIDDKKFKLEK